MSHRKFANFERNLMLERLFCSLAHTHWFMLGLMLLLTAKIWKKNQKENIQFLVGLYISFGMLLVTHYNIMDAFCRLFSAIRLHVWTRDFHVEKQWAKRKRACSSTVNHHVVIRKCACVQWNAWTSVPHISQRCSQKKGNNVIIYHDVMLLWLFVTTNICQSLNMIHERF